MTSIELLKKMEFFVTAPPSPPPPPSLSLVSYVVLWCWGTNRKRSKIFLRTWRRGGGGEGVFLKNPKIITTVGVLTAFVHCTVHTTLRRHLWVQPDTASHANTHLLLREGTKVYRVSSRAEYNLQSHFEPSCSSCTESLTGAMRKSCCPHLFQTKICFTCFPRLMVPEKNI